MRRTGLLLLTVLLLGILCPVQRAVAASWHIAPPAVPLPTMRLTPVAQMLLTPTDAETIRDAGGFPLGSPCAGSLAPAWEQARSPDIRRVALAFASPLSPSSLFSPLSLLPPLSWGMPGAALLAFSVRTTVLRT